MTTQLKRPDLIFPDLSYKIIGCAFNVHNQIGPGHHEKYYQRALAEDFKKSELRFKEQVYYPLKYENKIIGKIYLDFLIEDKIVVEIKKGNRYSQRYINQVLNYLKINNFKLAILINFGKNEVTYKRLINFDSQIRMD